MLDLTHLDHYQYEAFKTNNNANLWYHGLGLGGEAGEALEVVKKSYRPGRTLDRAKLVEELGDTLWYLASTASIAGISLSEIAHANLQKTQNRAAAGADMAGWAK